MRMFEKLSGEAGVSSHIDCATENASREVETKFVEVMEIEAGAESEGFTFADILQRTAFLSATFLEVEVERSELRLC